MKNNTKKLVLISMFIAISLVGSYIKIPSPVGTIGLDSMAGFLAGLIFGIIPGGIIGFLGHIFTSSNIGFPLSFPVHLIIAVMMFITISLYSFTYQKTNIYVAAIVGILLNGIISPLVLTLLPGFGWAFFIGHVLFLLLGSALNVILSTLVYLSLKNTILKDKRIW